MGVVRGELGGEHGCKLRVGGRVLDDKLGGFLRAEQACGDGDDALRGAQQLEHGLDHGASRVPVSRCIGNVAELCRTSSKWKLGGDLAQLCAKRCGLLPVLARTLKQLEELGASCTKCSQPLEAELGGWFGLRDSGDGFLRRERELAVEGEPNKAMKARAGRGTNGVWAHAKQPLKRDLSGLGLAQDGFALEHLLDVACGLGAKAVEHRSELWVGRG